MNPHAPGGLIACGVIWGLGSALHICNASDHALHQHQCRCGAVMSAASDETPTVPSFDSPGAALIAAERQRQVEVEGWEAKHDDRHDKGELIAAARCYAYAAACQVGSGIPTNTPPGGPWPWSDGWWKPSTDPIRNLVKAGALIAAEIDRLKRAKDRAHP